MTRKEEISGAHPNPTPRTGFAIARSRPTSIIDSTPAVDITTESALSSSTTSFDPVTSSSPGKHSQSVVDRLSATMQIDNDAAAAAKKQRSRRSSANSRSSQEGSPKAKLPSLMKSTAILGPAKPVTSTEMTSDLVTAGPSTQEPQTASMSRQGSREKPAKATKTSDTLSVVKHKPTAPPLVALLSDSTTSKLIKQGAEAKVYVSTIFTNDVMSWPQTRTSSSLTLQHVEPPAPVLLKWRFPKTYRHPTLSRNITASRTLMEARALLRCAKAGVAVPAIRCVDEKEGILGLELVPGKSVREWLGGGAEGEDETLVDSSSETEEEEEVSLSEADQVQVMKLIGRQLAVMHEADIIHGDLTTSNMMLRSRAGSDLVSTLDLEQAEIVLIDFGLSSVSAFAEDKAVDLYVLERAFASTHPASEALFKTVLDTYAEEVTKRSSGKNRGKGGRLDKWEETRRKLDEVRLRGRKRSMIGPDLFKHNHASRVVVNFELSLQIEARGVVKAIKTAPAMLESFLGVRPQRMLRHAPSLRKSRVKGHFEGTQWHQLASRMDEELDQIGSTRLLASHAHPESYARQELAGKHSLLSAALISFRSVSLPKLPLIGFAERVAVAGLEKAWDVCSRLTLAFPNSQSAPLSLRTRQTKSKTA